MIMDRSGENDMCAPLDTSRSRVKRPVADVDAIDLNLGAGLGPKHDANGHPGSSGGSVPPAPM